MTTAPPGWYPDPAGSTHRRWWDGTQWGPGPEQAPRLPTSPLDRWKPWQKGLGLGLLLLAAFVIAATGLWDAIYGG